MPEDKPSPQVQPGSNDTDDKTPHPVFDWRPLLFTLLTFMLYMAVTEQGGKRTEALPYSEFKQEVSENRISEVTLQGLEIQGQRLGTDGQNTASAFKTRLPEIGDDRLIPLLETHNVKLTVKSSEWPVWLTVIVNLLPWLLIFGFFAYSNHALQSRIGGNRFGLGASKAKLYEKLSVSIGFDEVAGLESAKADLQEVIDYLTQPQRFRELGAQLPKGILMMGPPGTGKTLLAKATAAEAGVPFYSISGSEFIEMFVGVGASRVRAMFSEAREKAPSLIFIDEIDSVGRVRGTGMGGGNDEREQTLNQILAEMDGFSSEEPIVVLAATNRPDVLDPALLRPGRFDRKVTLDLPQRKARLRILEVHTRKKPIAETLDLDNYAARTIGFSGADLRNLVNEAALHAARQGKHEIDHDDFEYAHDKILLGSEGQEILNPQDRERVAYHESGHALTAFLSPDADPLSKITIIPRGRAMGVTETRPREDRLNFNQSYLEQRLRILLGGRCAEKLVYGQLSSGAADDLKQATRLARSMVSQWGMSERLGPVNYPQHEAHPFLGMDMAQPQDFSDKTARLIDEEVESLLKRSERETFKILSDNRQQLERLAQAVLERETLELKDIESLLAPEHTNSTGERREPVGTG